MAGDKTADGPPGEFLRDLPGRGKAYATGRNAVEIFLAVDGDAVELDRLGPRFAIKQRRFDHCAFPPW